MALQGLLWLPEAVSNQDQGVGSTRQAQEDYSILSVPGGPGGLENGLFLSSHAGSPEQDWLAGPSASPGSHMWVHNSHRIWIFFILIFGSGSHCVALAGLKLPI